MVAEMFGLEGHFFLSLNLNNKGRG